MAEQQGDCSRIIRALMDEVQLRMHGDFWRECAFQEMLKAHSIVVV